MSSSGDGSVVSREENLVMSSEDSSDEAELELGLGLSLYGGGAAFHLKLVNEAVTVRGRILTAKDFPPSSSSSSSSSSTLSRANASAGTKRSADSVAAASTSVSQVVGWPPIRAYRVNSMANQAKSLVTEEFNTMIKINKSKTTVVEKSNTCSNNTNGNAKLRTSLFVKVNMDGIPIGRKVDLNAHSCYETLAQTLEDMFLRPTTTVNAIRSSIQEDMMAGARRSSKLLDGSSQFVLTYEDKEGDWMLIGDVPWGMFLSSVKRLRIMRTSEATGLAPRLQDRNGRQG